MIGVPFNTDAHLEDQTKSYVTKGVTQLLHDKMKDPDNKLKIKVTDISRKKKTKEINSCRTISHD